MKKIFFLSIIVGVLFSCNEKKQEPPKNSDLLADNLNGSVEKTVATDYKVDSTGKIGEQDSCCVATSNYNEKGYYVSTSSVDKAGTNLEEEAYTHYDDGAVKSILITKNAHPDLSISVQVGKDGKYVSATGTDSAGALTFYMTDITQNDYGQITGMKRFNKDSTLSATIVNSYDNQFYTSGTSTDSTGKLIRSSERKRDDKNNTMEEDSKDLSKDSTVQKIRKFTYDSFDDQGNWTQRTTRDETGKVLQIQKREVTYFKK